jgi:hypothetical protein
MGIDLWLETDSRRIMDHIGSDDYDLIVDLGTAGAHYNLYIGDIWDWLERHNKRDIIKHKELLRQLFKACRDQDEYTTVRLC